MRSHLPGMNRAGVKWISGFPGNPARGLPTIQGLLVLSETETGQPIAVMDCTWITAMRTAASTVVAAKRLARPDSSSIGILAAGLQGRRNLEALAQVFPIRNVKVFDIAQDRAEAFAYEMNEKLGVEVSVELGEEDVARDVDIVVSSGPIRKQALPVIGAGVMRPGTFACLLDFDATFDGSALREADRFVVDDVGQFAHMRREGYLGGILDPDSDLGHVVAGRLPGRQSEEELIVAMNLGIGLLDIYVGCKLLELARERRLGTDLEL